MIKIDISVMTLCLFLEAQRCDKILRKTDHYPLSHYVHMPTDRVMRSAVGDRTSFECPFPAPEGLVFRHKMRHTFRIFVYMRLRFL